MDYNKLINIKNRSDSTVGYTIPDSGVRRTWSPGEVKTGITAKELEEVTFTPGGRVILEEYLLINDTEVCDFLGIKTEPEYFYNEAEILKLLQHGSLDQLLDCLDFAPDGVLDMIKDISVKVKVNDISKRDAIKSKLGFDVTAAILNKEYSESNDAGSNSGAGNGRRSAPVSVDTEKTTGRRSQTPSYNRVEK